MVRVAIIVNTSWNIYNFRLGLLRAFREKGWEVLAIAPDDDFSRLLVQEGFQFVPLKMENKGSNPFQDLLLMRNLYQIYTKFRPDIVLHFTIKPNIYGTLAARLAGIPAINNVSGLGTVFLHKNLVSAVARTLYRIAFRYPEKVYFQNPDDRKLFLQLGLIKEHKTGLLPGSGVNLEKFVPDTFRRNSPFTFLVISRLLRDKGLAEYAEAASILKRKYSGLRFLLMGAPDPGPLGIPEKTLAAWTGEGWIEYVPFREDVRPFIQQADCVVLPSYREGTPKTLLEAASMAKPLIATDVPGCREAVQEGVNGFLCKVKDAEDLAAKMEKMLLQDNETLKFQGGKSREMVVLKFDERIVVREYLQAIASILGIGQIGDLKKPC